MHRDVGHGCHEWARTLRKSATLTTPGLLRHAYSDLFLPDCNYCMILQRMQTTVKRRTRRSAAHIIDHPGAIRLLASPFRQAILDAISADGPLSVAELSAVFRRPPDRL